MQRETPHPPTSHADNIENVSRYTMQSPGNPLSSDIQTYRPTFTRDQKSTIREDPNPEPSSADSKGLL